MKSLSKKIKEIYSVFMWIYIGIFSTITIIFCLLVMWSEESNYLWLFWIVVFCCVLLIPIVIIYFDMKGKNNESI